MPQMDDMRRLWSGGDFSEIARMAGHDRRTVGSACSRVDAH